MDWEILLEILAVIGAIAAIFGVILAPMFWLGAKIDSFREEFRKDVKAFHGRLCTLEAKVKD